MFTDQDKAALNYCLNALNNYSYQITFVNGEMVFPTGVNSYGPFNDYGTYTDPANYRRLRLSMDAAGLVTISAEGLGTGLTGNAMNISIDGSTRISWSAGGTTMAVTNSLSIGTTSTFRFGSDRTRIACPSDGVLNVTTSSSGPATAIQFGGTQIIGSRNTGWTAQTATSSKANLGTAPTVNAIASWCRAIQDALVTHGLLGA